MGMTTGDSCMAVGSSDPGGIHHSFDSALAGSPDCCYTASCSFDYSADTFFYLL